MLNEESKEVDLHQVTFDQKRAGSPTNRAGPTAAEVPKVVQSPEVLAKPKEAVKPAEVPEVKPK